MGGGPKSSDFLSAIFIKLMILHRFEMFASHGDEFAMYLEPFG